MRRQLVALGLAAYVLGLLFMAPASLLDAALRLASDGTLRLAEAQGSLWSGTGQIEIRSHPAGSRTGIAKALAWRLLPVSSLGGHLNCEIRLDHAEQPFLVTLSLSRIDVDNAVIDLPARALGLAVPKLAALGLGGEMQLQVAHLSFGKKGLQGNATLQWHGASSALTKVAPLGDYELSIADEGATLRTLQGPLELDGKAMWTQGGKPIFRANAHIPPQHVQQLAPLLRLIAIERGQGDFELQLK